MKKALYVILFTLSLAASAQTTGAIKGLVTDREMNDEPLPFAPTDDETDVPAIQGFPQSWVGDFDVMELELIEPSLYLRTDPEAPLRFARAVDAWFEKASESGNR